MISIFPCGLSLHRKTYPPILVRWFLFHFSEITYAKTHLFFLAASFPNKDFVFPNNRISEARICRQDWFRKTCTFACVIARKRTTKQQKKLRGNVFLLSPTSRAKIYLISRPPKKAAKEVTYMVLAHGPSFMNNVIKLTIIITGLVYNTINTDHQKFYSVPFNTFELSHLRISWTKSKVRTTLHSTINSITGK